MENLDNNFAKATLSSIRVSPRKLNLIADTIRNFKVSDALVQLNFSTKRASKIIKKCLDSAVANAEHNQGLDVDNLFVHRVLVGKSFTLKRFSARARGRGARIQKHYSNLRIILVEHEEKS